MTLKKAQALATGLDGQVERGPTDRDWSVGLTRPDGRYVLIEEGAGACYFDRVACWEGYMVHGSDPRGDIHAQEWNAWDGSEKWATDLADLLGPTAQPYHSGGGIWLVYYTRADGKCACVGEESVGLYPSLEAALDAWEGGADESNWWFDDFA